MTEELQKTLQQPASERVDITFDVESEGVVNKRTLPFIVAILADLGGERDASAPGPLPGARAMIDVHRDNLDEVMAAIKPRVALDKLNADDPLLGEILTAPGDAALTFSAMAAFNPLSVVRSLPSLNALYTARSQIRTLQSKAEADELVGAQLTAYADKLLAGSTADDVSGDGNAASFTQFAVLLNAWTTLLDRLDHAGVEMGLAGITGITAARASGIVAMLDEWVAQIDVLLSAALSRILHSAGFKAIEATWRGLNYLVTQTDTSDLLRLHVLDVSMQALRQDLVTAGKYDRSHLYKLLDDASRNAPYSLMIGDYPIRNDIHDLDLLGRVAEIAAAVHAPLIAQASEALFGLDSFSLLNRPRTLVKIFDLQDAAEWRDFRAQDNARYVALTLPRVLLRLPYGEPDGCNAVPCEGFNFNEETGVAPGAGATGKDKPDPNSFLWGNPAYFLGWRIAAAFSRYGWTADIFGDEGGLVEGLPAYTYATPGGGMATLGPIETDITDQREEELRPLGFIGLCHRSGTNDAVFRSSQTTSWPKRYFDNLANANAQMMDSLPCVLVMSRLALYVKAIMQNKIGSFMTRANVESYLNDWLSNYVLLDDNASPRVSAAYPLKQARAVVEDVPEAPGTYRASLFVQPRFQLEQLTVSARVVVYL